MEDKALQHLTKKVSQLAKEIGQFIRHERLNFHYNRVMVKGINDLVSDVDQKAEQMIVDALQKILAEAGFLVEENTLSEKKEMNWIVDPLDGTTNFIHGIPCYAVSIALEHKGDVIIGVVYEINRDECFSAYSNGGAFLNEKPIQVSEIKNLSESLIATGFPIFNFNRLNAYLATLKYFMQNTHGVRRIGSAATDLCYLACGRVDAFFEYNLNPWDVAAGALIVKEAGGFVSDFSGNNNWLYGKEIIGSNFLLRDEFGAIIQKYFSEDLTS